MKEIFTCLLLTSNQKIFLSFKSYKLHSPYGLMQVFVVFEKFTCAYMYLFQIALKIIWLPIQISPLVQLGSLVCFIYYNVLPYNKTK